VIAQEVGFADQSHLTMVFRREIGMTPGQYRTALA
jgi:AraC-like DNA-binding protein